METMYILDTATHRAWLAAESDRLLQFFEQGSVNPDGGFYWLDASGAAQADKPQPLWFIARLVYCFSVEHLLGRPGAKQIAEHGVRRLLSRFRDQEWGGYFAAIDPDGVVRSSEKETYGHAFALLAGTSAHRAEIDGAEEVISIAMEAVDSRLWVDADGAAVDSFDRHWTIPEDYRGQNANMHLTEAFLALYEATGRERYLQRAERVSDRLINRVARAHSWRIPEHFDADWRVDANYNVQHPDDPFRPYGTLVGHSFEWCRLVLQLQALSPSLTWTVEAAIQLFDRALADGWDEEGGGFLYSVDLAGVPVNKSRMHWALAEAIGAAVWLYRATADNAYLVWYEAFWRYADRAVIDREGGSWWHELDTTNAPASTVWDGKPDLYHAWQATLYARIDGPHGVAEAAARGMVSGQSHWSNRLSNGRANQ